MPVYVIMYAYTAAQLADWARLGESSASPSDWVRKKTPPPITLLHIDNYFKKE